LQGTGGNNSVLPGQSSAAQETEDKGLDP